jgi:hypothetical protein
MLNGEMNGRSEERRAPTDIPVPITALLIPIFLIVGALSIPVAGVLAFYFKLSERRFVRQMRSRNRLMDWPQFLQCVAEKHGTMIEEWLSEKGPVRRWWVADDLAEISPFVRPEHGVEALFDSDHQFGPCCAWCYENYTNDRSGSALLLASSYIPKLWDRTEDLIPTITIPVAATAATARQRSRWASPIR